MGKGSSYVSLSIVPIIVQRRVILDQPISESLKEGMGKGLSSRRGSDPVKIRLNLPESSYQPKDDEMLIPHSDLVVEGPQPMEVAPAESANTNDAQSVEDQPSARFTWMIENFSRLNTLKIYSEAFDVGGYKWRVLIFPKGKNVDHLSMYLDVADSSNLPYGWGRYTHFNLAVINQMHNKFTVREGYCPTIG